MARSRIQSQFALIRRHQALIEAYSGDGWRGGAAAKPKPLKELEKAREKIFEAKLKIRELFKVLEFDESEREITTVADELGECDAADIFCSKCTLADDREDDDILLCDGFCDRAYHQSCVNPPVKDEDIPPDDEGWLCPRCDARVDVIYVLNDEYEQDLGQRCVAADVFKAEAEMQAKGIVPGTAQFRHAHEEEWPSDESDDEDFDQAGLSDDGQDDEQEALSGSARSSSDESSSESESDLIIDGPRKRTKVDYVALNNAMFGEGEAYEGEAEELGWKRSNKTKAEMLAALKLADEKNGDRSTPSAKTPNGTVAKRANTASSDERDDGDRRRTRFTAAQKAELVRVFASRPTPAREELSALASDLGVPRESVKIWFMNQRRRTRVTTTASSPSRPRRDAARAAR